MIDFENAKFLKMHQVDNKTFEPMILPMFVDNENIVATFQTTRDGIIFTNKRVIAINIQGVTGKKKDFTSLPYNKIQAFSVETAGVLDLDSELELWFSGMGKVHFDFTKKADVTKLCQMISSYVLK